MTTAWRHGSKRQRHPSPRPCGNVTTVRRRCGPARKRRSESAIPALTERESRGMKLAPRRLGMRMPCAWRRVERGITVGQITEVDRELAKDQMMEETRRTIRIRSQLRLPVGCGQIAPMCVQKRPRPLVLVVGPLMMVAQIRAGNHPVPVQHGHVVVKIGERVPAQEVIVVNTDLPRRVVMADIVIVGLRQRNMHGAENHDRDSQIAQTPERFLPPRQEHSNLIRSWQITTDRQQTHATCPCTNPGGRVSARAECHCRLGEPSRFRIRQGRLAGVTYRASEGVRLLTQYYGPRSKAGQVADRDEAPRTPKHDSGRHDNRGSDLSDARDISCTGTRDQSCRPRG